MNSDVYILSYAGELSVKAKGTRNRFSERLARNLADALASAGVGLEDIDIVLHTHLHYDHVANNEAFPKARFLAPPEEIDWALDPPHYWGAGPYFPEFADPLRAVKDRLRPLRREGEIIPGVKYFRLGGHSPGFTAVAVTTALGRAVIAGDIMFDSFNAEYD